MRGIKRDALPILWILTAGFLLSYRFLFEGYLYGYDAQTHVLWAQQFLKSFYSGNIYPRWMMDLNAGYGSPALIIYPPFILYSYIPINFFVKEIPLVLSISAAAALMASGLSMYVYCRLFFGRTTSSIAATVYLALPYHMQVIYQSSAITSFWAWSWLPLVLYFIHRLGGKNVFSFAGLSVCYGGLIFTHLPTALLYSPFLLAYAAFIGFREKDFLKIFLRGILALGVGAALSSVYLLPAVFEEKYLSIHYLTSGYNYDFRNNFLFYREGLNAEISRMAVAALLVIVLSMAVSFLKRKRAAVAQEMFFISLCGIASFLMMTGLAKPLWEALTFLQKLHFPWRMMNVTSVFAALCAGASFHYVGKIRGRAMKIPIMLALGGILALNGVLSGNVIMNFLKLDHSFKGFSIRADMSYAELSQSYSRFVSPSLQETPPEALPPSQLESYLASMQLIDHTEFNPVWTSRISDRRSMFDDENIYAFFSEGAGRADIISWRPEDRRLRIETPTGGKLLLRTFYYPGWKGYADDKPIKLDLDPSSALLYIPASPGSYDIVLRYEGTQWQKAGKAVSLLTALVLIGVYFRARLRFKV